MLVFSAFFFGSIFAVAMPVVGPLVFAIICSSYFNLSVVETVGVLLPLLFLQLLCGALFLLCGVED